MNLKQIQVLPKGLVTAVYRVADGSENKVPIHFIGIQQEDGSAVFLDCDDSGCYDDPAAEKTFLRFDFNDNYL